eukprot:TRINITY_DN1530_c0_g1_i1.p1 TRINITY_DN1530_c0_g1~~TRINITY_DN1530_c0_g1_i1.p1  ORF type:complete len:305 (+),score=77.66 TRINITY_DN1530_c0_g1_i1:39-917(+)
MARTATACFFVLLVLVGLSESIVKKKTTRTSKYNNPNNYLRGIFPWMASVQLKSGFLGSIVQGICPRMGHSCGGSLLSSEWLLTAKHCVSKDPQTWKEWYTPGEFRVIINRSDFNDKSAGEEHTVDAIYYHSGLDISRNDLKHWRSDIALLHLAAPSKVTNFVKLPTAVSNKGDRLDVLGFGLTEEGCIDRYLRKATLRNQGKTPLGFVFGGPADNKGGCMGDSGGPLIGHIPRTSSRVSPTIYGIVSYGDQKCAEGEAVEGNAISVFDYLNWIEKVVNGHKGKSSTSIGVN